MPGPSLQDSGPLPDSPGETEAAWLDAQLKAWFEAMLKAPVPFYLMRQLERLQGPEDDKR